MKSDKWHIKLGYSFLKLAIVAVSVYFIYFKVISRPDFEEMAGNISMTIQKSENHVTIIIVLLLMIFNWFIETAKWKLLLERICTVSWLRGFRSVLSGVTISVFTPNRMGEFAGRVMHLESGTRIKAAIASVIGSMNQLLITIVAGGFGLLVSLREFDPQDSFLYRIKFLLILIGICASIFIYFNMSFLARLGEYIKSIRKISLYTRVFALFPGGELVKLTFYSALRYLVFTFQFYLLLNLFGIELEYLDSLRVISIIYLVMAVVPSIALSELTIRGSVALYFLTPFTGNSAGILAATSLLWFVNLILPALSGAIAAFYFKFYK